MQQSSDERVSELEVAKFQAETAKITAETAKITAEAAKITAEAAKTNAEAARINAETEGILDNNRSKRKHETDNQDCNGSLTATPRSVSPEV